MNQGSGDVQEFLSYSGTRYVDSRARTKILVVESGVLNTSTTSFSLSFSVSLTEPLLIDKHYDIYLDNFTTHNAQKNTKENGSDDPTSNQHCFCLGIDQFNIQTSSNNPHMAGKIVIPNEETTAFGTNTLKIHKGRKMNYVCTINPGKLSTISGSITGRNGTTIGEPYFRFVAEFLFVESR